MTTYAGRRTASGATVTVDGALVPALQVFGAAYTKSFNGTTATQLFYLDAGNDSLLTTAAPNEGMLTPVGPLGIAVGTEGDLDIFGGQDGVVFAALNPDGTAGSQLYRVNLATGAATRTPTLPPAPRLRAARCAARWTRYASRSTRRPDSRSPTASKDASPT